MVKYFRAVPISIPMCAPGSRAAVEVDLGSGEKAVYVFVKEGGRELRGDGDLAAMFLRADKEGGRELRGDGDLAAMFLRADKAWLDGVEYGTQDVWLNNHDAFPTESLNMGKLLADGVSFTADHVWRLQIPYTAWTMELTDTDGKAPEVPEYAPGPNYASVNLCRGDPRLFPGYSTPWRKSTFMTSDPKGAVDFVIDIFGASSINNTYPWPPVEGCTAALWAEMPSGFQFHFVLGAPSFVSNLQASVADALARGSFDQLMYNSLVFRVQDLDLYVERLQARSMAFYVMRLNAGDLSLFANIPGTISMVQLRGSHVSKVRPISLEREETCMQRFGS